MDGVIDLDDMRYRWALRPSPKRYGRRGCTLQVTFGDMSVVRQYPGRLSRTEAQKEASLIAPEVFRKVV